MTRHFDPADLPEDVARYAQAQVAAGRFASIEDVLSAGIEALQAREQADQEWLAYAETRRKTALRRSIVVKASGAPSTNIWPGLTPPCALVPPHGPAGRCRPRRFHLGAIAGAPNPA